MAKRSVKNISGVELMIPNVGLIKPGEVIEVDEGFRNANFVDEKAPRAPSVGDEQEDKAKKKTKV